MLHTTVIVVETQNRFNHKKQKNIDLRSIHTIRNVNVTSQTGNVTSKYVFIY